MKEQDLETAVLASIQSQARLLLQAETKREEGQVSDALDNQIQECQTEISRCKAKQAGAFEDYAEGRMTRQAYLSCKQETADRQEEMTARYMELSAEKARMQQAPGTLKKSDLGRYACANELTRDLLVELIKEIRVSVENELEIAWNFREFGLDQEG